MGWADEIQPYLKSIQIYQCPSDEREPSTNPVGSGYSDYWYNSNLSSTNDDATGIAPASYFTNVPVNVAALPYSTLTLMCGDGLAIGNPNSTAAYRIAGFSSAGGYSPPSPPAVGILNNPNPNTSRGFVNTGNIVARHLDGVNLLFADGHVKWIKTNASGNKGFFYRSPTPFTGTGIVSGQSPTFRTREP